MDNNENLTPEEFIKLRNKKFEWEVPEGKKCDRCGDHSASHVYSEGTMALVHGSYNHLCNCCLLTRQLNHALDMAEKIPSLRNSLKIALEGCK